MYSFSKLGILTKSFEYSITLKIFIGCDIVLDGSISFCSLYEYTDEELGCRIKNSLCLSFCVSQRNQKRFWPC